jgi:hypothetical protein
MDYSEQREQHREDTKYIQWEDGMYVMLDDLECDHELAVVENSLRDSVYYTFPALFGSPSSEDTLGVFKKEAGTFWHNDNKSTTKLTRAQALYIATGDVNI